MKSGKLVYIIYFIKQTINNQLSPFFHAWKKNKVWQFHTRKIIKVKLNFTYKTSVEYNIKHKLEGPCEATDLYTFKLIVLVWYYPGQIVVVTFQDLLGPINRAEEDVDVKFNIVLFLIYVLRESWLLTNHRMGWTTVLKSRTRRSLPNYPRLLLKTYLNDTVIGKLLRKTR